MAETAQPRFGTAYSDLVSDEKLEELTGYTRAAEQTRVLRSMGLQPFPGRNGHPRVTWEAVNRIMAGTPVEARRGAEPDWSAMDGP